jgi:putative transposase
MRENGLVVKGRKARKYCSYKGEISPEVPNVIQRNFRDDKPNQKVALVSREVRNFGTPENELGYV